MTQKRLQRLKRRIQQLYGSDRKSRELEGVARGLERRPVKRGAYTWENAAFPQLSPLSIPHHSKPVKRFTAEGILDQLLAQDVWAWERHLESEAQHADE